MVNFARLYVPKCKHCSNCQSWEGDIRHRHYCQMKLQKFWHEGKDERKDGVKEVLVRLADCACEHFNDKRI